MSLLSGETSCAVAAARALSAHARPSLALLPLSLLFLLATAVAVVEGAEDVNRGAIVTIKSNTATAEGPSDANRTSRFQSHHSFCPINIASAVACPEDTPVCCRYFTTVRCCATVDVAAAGGCEGCPPTQESHGYEAARGSAMLGMMTASILMLIGSMVTSGVGRHCAWKLERSHVIAEYQARQQLRRQEAREYRRELEETAVPNVPDGEACVVCCARYVDAALVPCGHVCVCRFCARRLKECPVCRATVVECYRLPPYLMRQLLRRCDVVIAEYSSHSSDGTTGRGNVDGVARIDHEGGGEPGGVEMRVVAARQSSEVGVGREGCDSGDSAPPAMAIPSPVQVTTGRGGHRRSDRLHHSLLGARHGYAHLPVAEGGDGSDKSEASLSVSEMEEEHEVLDMTRPCTR